MFTGEQKRVIEKWLKAHGKWINLAREHEDFWKLFERSATRDLVDEFNKAAGESGIRIERTKKTDEKRKQNENQ